MRNSEFEKRRYPAIVRAKRFLKVPRDQVLFDQRFNMTEDARGLERLFPGCTVAWDVNPVTRSWYSAYLRIVNNIPDRISYQVGKQWRTSMHHVRMQGHLLLRAFELDERGLARQIRSLPIGYGHFHVASATYIPTEERWVVIR